jgi:hypothetical protein
MVEDDDIEDIKADELKKNMNKNSWSSRYRGTLLLLGSYTVLKY